MLRTLLASALICGCVALGASLAGAATPAAPVSPQLQDLVRTIDGPTANPRDQEYRPLRKLDSQVQALASDRLDTTPGPTSAIDTAGARVTPGGRVLVDVYVNGDITAARSALSDAGLDVISSSDAPPQRMIAGWLPAANAPAVAALAVTRSVVAVGLPQTSSVHSLGDDRINGPQARFVGGVSGAGIPVGVISDSFNVKGGMNADVASQDLPANVNVVEEGPPTGSDEGRAMAQLLYDTAPGVTSMFFESSFNQDAAHKAAVIDDLVNNRHVRVITDDTAFLDQPFFQDGVVEQAVDRARANGVAYFAAAGNGGQDAWEGTASGGNGPVVNQLTDFNPGGVPDTRQTVATVPPGGNLTMVTEWDEAWNTLLKNHFTLRMFVDGILAGTSTPAATIPEADLTYSNPSTTTSHTVSLEISRAGSGPPPHLKTMFYRDFGFVPPATTIPSEYPTNSPTVGPDAAAAAGAFSVAAVRQSDGLTTPGDLSDDLNTAEPFSSRGPVTRVFDAGGNRLPSPVTRAKPDLAAPDGVQTTVPGFNCSPGSSQCFFGTSAASPAAAGVAALMLSANPSLPIDTLRSIMTNPANAIDCLPTVGPDDDCGAGFIQADRMLSAVDRTPPAVTANVSPGTPDGANGWYRSDVAVNWTFGDPETPAVTPSGCDPANIATDGVRTLTCTVSGASGTTTRPLTIRRDASPPSTPGFTGIAARAYAVSQLPRPTAIGCLATDAVSGLLSCGVTGYSATLGAHVLTARATNGAGLTSTSTLAYAVTADPPPKAAGGLSLRKVSLGKLRSRGLTLTLRAAKSGTRLAVTLTAKLPGARKASTIGTLKTTVRAGSAKIRVKLTRKAARRLQRTRRTKVTVKVVASATGATKTSLTGTLTAKR